MSHLRAVIFDFDGVLADTERLHFKAFCEVLADEDIELTPQEYAARYLGRSDREVFNALAHDRQLALDANRLDSLLSRKATHYDALVASETVMIPGVAGKVRAWAERVPLAVASGARRSEIEQVLVECGLLGYFAAIVAVEDVTRGKPAPDPYLLALRRLNEAEGGRGKAEGGRGKAEGEKRRAEDDRDGARATIAAHEVVALEDSPAGLASIRAAGMHPVAVSTNYPATVLAPRAELVIASLADVDLDALQRLVER